MRTRVSRNFLARSVGVVVLVAAATATGTALGGCQRQNSRSAERSSTSSASSSAKPNTGISNPTVARHQLTLPITPSENFYPHDVAVDAHGTVYATTVNEGVLKLAPGAQAAVSVGFSGLQFAVSGGVDAAGNVYVTDDGGGANGTGRVQQRSPAGAQTVLSFTGLGQDPRLAVAPDGTVYVADRANNRVLKLAQGATSPSELPFTGLNDPGYVAVDSTGNIYVSDVGNSRVLTLPAGSTAQRVLPITAQKQSAITVDNSGNIYLAGARGVTVLAKGSQQATQLPVSSGPGGSPQLLGIAVDTLGNIYLADNQNDQFIELKT
jgi:serine/threonine protein kinase, bacterial